VIKTGLRIWAYALMTNHVHFVAVPKAAETLGVFFRNVDGTYADYFNTKYDQVGHLWGERFKSSVLDEPYLWNAVRYVELNPVRAGMVDRAEDYRWSSAPAHCGLREDSLLSSDLPLLGQIADWATWLRGELSLEEMEVIRRRTHSGRPCGDEAFLRNLSTQLGRDLLPKKRGPKQKIASDDELQAKLFLKSLGVE
jgi:putative transposase